MKPSWPAPEPAICRRATLRDIGGLKLAATYRLRPGAFEVAFLSDFARPRHRPVATLPF
jgi:hypothetical protein